AVFKRLFILVGIGNSCSSPMAEAIMQNLMVKTSLYWEVDSAGLRTWNTGRKPHKRCLQTLREHGLRSDHFCRQFAVNDFHYFDYVVAMDETVYKELLYWGGVNRAFEKNCEILLLSAFGKNGQPAVIYSLSPTRKLRNFRTAYYQIKDCCKQLILSQKVDIFRYELPSSDDDLYFAAAPNDSNAKKAASAVGKALKTSGDTTDCEGSRDGRVAKKGTTKDSGTYIVTPESRSSGGQVAPRSSYTNISQDSSYQPGAVAGSDFKTSNMDNSIHCNQQPRGTQRKLCQKCGQKFLAAL
ncbi:hypothetical protein KR074_006300, partial [Drosophila pseudoananassae]